MNFTLKVFKNNHIIQKVQTHSKRRFYNRIRTINWKDGDIKAYIRINYGKKIDSYGKRTIFFNDGWYDNKKDLWKMFIAFCEEN